MQTFAVSLIPNNRNRYSSIECSGSSNKIEIKEDETHYQLLNFIKASFAYESEIMAIITERKDPMDTIKTLENLSAAIFLMKAYVMGRNGA